MNERKSAILIWLISLLTVASVFFCIGIAAAPLFAPSITEPQEYNLIPVPEDTSSTAISEIGKVCLNTATTEELMTIPGIGQVMANRIIEYRELIGSFTYMEQLLEVRGIGETRYQQFASYLTLE